MKILFFAFSIVLISGSECILKKQSCKDLNTKEQCENTDKNASKCYWNNSCYNQQYQSCYYYYTESECQEKNSCDWQHGQCMVKLKQQNIMSEIEEEKCENIDNYAVCVDLNGLQRLFCTWKHGHCYSVQKCSDIVDVRQCRRAHRKERCQYVLNNVGSSKQDEYVYATDIFDYKSCRIEDCMFKAYTSCPQFVNGRRCILKSGQCTQCSYQTNPKDCIATNYCTWQGSECSNIMCSQITSKRLCNEISYCQYDFTTQNCQINNQDKISHCSYYNFSSDPIKTKYNSFFGL